MPVAKKTTTQATGMENIRYLSHEYVPLDSLAQYVKNPRKGNVRIVAESLMEHGQYRPITLWTHENGKPRKQPEILAGNHTWKAAKFLDSVAKGKEEKPAWLAKAEQRLKRKVKEWPIIGLVTIDATPEEAAKIVLVDNRSADMGGYDPTQLRSLLASVPDPYGSGFNDEEYQLVLKAVGDAEVDLGELMERADSVERDGDEFGAAPSINTLIGLPEEEEEGEEEEGPRALLDAPTEIQGSIASLQEEPRFPGIGDMDIPSLRKDMLIEELPPSLETWAGSATRNWPDEDVQWFYNYGVDSTSGMDVSKLKLLGFYAWDEYFETWWFNTRDRVIQALNSGLRLAITPNYSQGGMPLVLSFYNLYRTRYVGRYMQEAGIRVMPDLEGGSNESLNEYMFKTLPAKLPWAAMQVQNVGAKTRGGDQSVFTLEKWESETRTVLEALKPDNLFVYANDNGMEMMTDLVRKKMGVKQMHLHHQSTRLEKLAKQAKNRQKKETL